MSHQYPTRFQARNAVKEQVPVKEQAPDQADALTDLYLKRISHLKDVEGLHVLLDRFTDNTLVARMKSSIEIFSYLSAHRALFDHPPFCKTVINKIAEFRREMEHKTKNAIDTFVSIYSPEGNPSHQVDALMEARDVLYYAPLLEAEFKKVGSCIDFLF